MSENPAERLRRQMAQYRQRMRRNLQVLGLIKIAPEELVDLESSMGESLPTVQPSAGFRDHLRQGLSLAAQQHSIGLTVEQRRTLHPGLALGLSAGLLATTLGLLLLLLRSRWAGAQHWTRT
jgi:hypothetical protein